MKAGEMNVNPYHYVLSMEQLGRF